MWSVFVKDTAKQSIDVGDVDLAVAVDVTNQCTVIITGSMAMAAATAVDDDVDHAVGIGNVDFAITVHVARDGELNAIDLVELLPAIVAHVVFE